MSKFTTEDDIEKYNLQLLDRLDYRYSHGTTSATTAGQPTTWKAKDSGGGTYLSLEQRHSFSEVLLKDRLGQAISHINPHIPPENRQQAQRDLQNIASPDLITNNETFHRYLTEGITVEYTKNGETKGEQLWLIDWDTPENNEFLAVNQFTIIEDKHNRRPDIILFINGIPLVVIELKNATDAKANLQAAYNQLQTYKYEIPSLFTYNALLIISDGISARAGSLSAPFSRFSQWKRKLPDGTIENNPNTNELEILVNGMLNKHTLLDLVRHFTVFEKVKQVDPGTEVVTLNTIKKVAAYHQYYAVNKAVECVLQACDIPSPNPSLWEGNQEVPRPMGEGFRERANFRASEEQAAYRGGLPVTTLLQQARELRQKQTPAEAIFWETVRAKRFCGLKFRRQHQIGNFIVDFYCHQHQLVIELDGGIHNQPEQQHRDQEREQYLSSLGHTVLRFSNQAIFEDLATVLNAIAAQVGLPSPSPKNQKVPCPMGEGFREKANVQTSKDQTSKAIAAQVGLPSPNPSHGEGDLEVPRPLGEGFRERGNHRGGVVWHTQGSGKSLSMVFLSGKLVLALDNPTLVILTDRNDLDDQLFDTFAGCRQLLRQAPQQADNRAAVRNLLNVSSGGIVFTTVQKFAPEDGETLYPQISPRSNIVVLADEAHRSQYGFKAKQVTLKDEDGNEIGKQTRYGFAKYIRDALPNATFVGFTGTPIDQTDKNTEEIFGKYIDIYDIAQAVEDGATVPIYYESRLVQVDLDQQGIELLEELDEDLSFEDLSTTQQAKANQTRVEAIVGSTQRLETIAQDIITHFEQRQKTNRGKGMIVTLSRRIAANLYEQITQLRPEWHSNDLNAGILKVVMTASASDEEKLVQHHTSKKDRQVLAQRLKDPDNSLELVIVCDMWLTGFDAPCLHTMYIDKPMKGHNLMQAIARINRVYFEKQGGLIVDYLGVAHELKEALNFYSQSGGKGDLSLDQEVAIGLMLTKLEVVEGIMADFDYQPYFTASTGDKLNLLKTATNHVAHPQIKDRFMDAVTALSRIYALVAHNPEAMDRAEEISFFQAIQASLRKLEPSDGGLSNVEIETAIRQVVDQALVSDTVVNIFDDAGIKSPDVSVISEEFLAEVEGMEHKNLAVELLKRLLRDEIKAQQRTNVVQSRKLADMLEDALRRYKNQVISVTDVMQELIEISKDVEAAKNRGEELGLESYELAFYDALAQNQSAKDIMGHDQLRELAIVLVARVRKNASIDWNLKETARARMKVMVKRLLRQYGYPPDQQAMAIELVLEQAKVFTEITVSG
ncbi:HsdR family type I site-specific deoxyribonuclease [Acaryochloris sp. IP29b_bin.137]|uniref:HsdR family type I site-specific deoxyribonuclease n=1 Tax=Acaryochloris sp. IP29b_bin.137 TaxID=2969217 RepID=UPI0026066928|nr:HsdR family type I site-specific deoxyribonuclease [Acaryochloris sp. IP29b_bin.137]